MFKFGGSDDDEEKREELRENINKIRDMVKQREGERGSSRQEPEETARQEPSGRERSAGESSRSRERTKPENGMQTRRQSSGRDLDVGETDIPEPPELKEIEVPDIERGPLFIRVQKFKEAKRMVDDMYELGGELETEMAGLRNTLEEDKNVGRRISETLKDIQDSLTTAKDIVSP